jgi:hypothetical protein
MCQPNGRYAAFANAKIIGDLLGSAAWRAGRPITLRDKRLAYGSNSWLPVRHKSASPLISIHDQIVMPITPGGGVLFQRNDLLG